MNNIIPPKKSKFAIKKENTICSLKDVENFLQEVTGASKGIKLYNLFKKFRKY